MDLPFTPDQFFNVFRQYNQAVWPMQIVLNLLALAAIGLLFRRHPSAGRMVAFILALLWAWTAIVYHLIHFAPINRAALVFAAVVLAGAGAFLWAGTIKGRMEFASTSPTWRLLGALLIVFALVIYPLLSAWLGHGYPAMPTFGLPCPTTIFTIGLLCFLSPPFPRYVLVAPLLWSAVGSQAAFLLGVYQDLGLLVAGVIAVALFFRTQDARTRMA